MEAVGFVGGASDGRAKLTIALPNLAGPRSFLADPYAQFQAERQLRGAGLTLLAIYHSHPGGGTQLSEVDKIFGARKDVLHVVVALNRSHYLGEEIRAFRVLGSSAKEVEIHREAAG